MDYELIFWAVAAIVGWALFVRWAVRNEGDKHTFDFGEQNQDDMEDI